MAWQDRIKPAVYVTGTSKTRLPFDFVDVKEGLDLLGSAFNFIGAGGTYVQRLGNSGRTFPLRIYITGPDYDTEADAFLDGLKEAGVGSLEHPIYGTVDALPLGRVSRRDDLVTRANQAVLEVTFWETLGTLYPTGQKDPASEVLSTVEDYNAAAASEFDDAADVDSQVERTALENQVLALVAATKAALAPVAAVVENVSDQFNDISDSITNSIDVLVGDPLTLAFQVSQLVQSPGRSTALWSDKLEAYSNLAGLIVSQSPRTPDNDSREQNSFYADNLTAVGSLTGAIVGAVNNTFSTRPEALTAAINILAMADSINTWREQNYEALGEVDTGASYQQWQKAAAITAGFLVEISFTLAQERIITLNRPRTIIDLAAELYGEVDEKLDFLIDSNDLSGDEMREIPAGREIKYYV